MKDVPDQSIDTPNVIDCQNSPKEDMNNDSEPIVVRVYTKAKVDYSLTIRDRKVILAPSNPSDPLQQWIKDEKFGKNIKDDEGFSSFALVNKATGQAIKHSIGVTYPVQLTDYNPQKLDKTVLWTTSKRLDDGYRAIRAVDNVHLNLDGFEGIPELGGVRDGTRMVLWDWVEGDNQKWTIVGYCPLRAFKMAFSTKRSENSQEIQQALALKYNDLLDLNEKQDDDNDA
ncbi:Ricin B lectin domain-containing protein [Artemisia annua]|uniref:Ricin B lectin domain-containing protein n=1 Tax=Artemisia annua TaxID=35608 RepID=A0A2U1PHD9_ARTAN|nr:Ricin B lectin domain-containing protein [Artemisia annua]